MIKYLGRYLSRHTRLRACLFAVTMALVRTVQVGIIVGGLTYFWREIFLPASMSGRLFVGLMVLFFFVASLCEYLWRKSEWE